MPKARTLDEIKLNLLQPALTSHFEVEIFPPSGLTQEYFSSNGVSGTSQDKLNLLCSETVLPGSSVATLELNNQYHGATVRHAYRRLYDDRIDLTFYVTADDYLPIRYFETWIKYVVGENIGGSNIPDNSRPGSLNSNYFYRVNYPKNYVSGKGLKITKFERTSTNRGQSYTGRTLQYQFIDVFPTYISSMPVSYDSSSLLKCTVSMTYLRYVMLPSSGEKPVHEDQNNSGSSLSPQQIAAANSTAFNPNVFGKDLGVDYGSQTTTGGVDYSKAFSSGNKVNVGNAYNSNLNLF